MEFKIWNSFSQGQKVSALCLRGSRPWAVALSRLLGPLGPGNFQYLSEWIEAFGLWVSVEF